MKLLKEHPAHERQAIIIYLVPSYVLSGTECRYMASVKGSFSCSCGSDCLGLHSETSDLSEISASRLLKNAEIV